MSGSEGLAFLVAVVGAVRAERSERSTWPWPLFGLVILGVAFVMGGSLAGSVR